MVFLEKTVTQHQIGKVGPGARSLSRTSLPIVGVCVSQAKRFVLRAPPGRPCSERPLSRLLAPKASGETPIEDPGHEGLVI